MWSGAVMPVRARLPRKSVRQIVTPSSGRMISSPCFLESTNMPVETNYVYILPPNKYMTISDGALRLTGPVERRGL